MNKEISKEELLEGLKENGYTYNEATIEKDIESGYFQVTLEKYQDADFIEVEKIGDMLVARFDQY